MVKPHIETGSSVIHRFKLEKKDCSLKKQKSYQQMTLFKHYGISYNSSPLFILLSNYSQTSSTNLILAQVMHTLMEWWVMHLQSHLRLVKPIFTPVRSLSLLLHFPSLFNRKLYNSFHTLKQKREGMTEWNGCLILLQYLLQNSEWMV